MIQRKIVFRVEEWEYLRTHQRLRQKQEIFGPSYTLQDMFRDEFISKLEEHPDEGITVSSPTKGYVAKREPLPVTESVANSPERTGRGRRKGAA